ncbi:anthranilate synthase, component I [Haladaptatus litoreus]|uniref:Anthranilate synthase component 1 n=1 Tax=Haladaptatus litoreus TaxID=553468 RepID=A0A1N6ZUI0_9EURY|nr:anthranilate synthase component I [Haladaptatus litoreus]SIR30444.1 anthranilate synthase, component I [Haladaptatus litoreus]
MNRDEFVAHADSDRSVVVHVETELDVDIDPLTAYSALGGNEYDFLLESADKVASSDPDGAFEPTGTATADRRARYSFVGYDPKAVVSVESNETEMQVLDEDWNDVVASGRDDEGDILDRLRNSLPDVERRGFPNRDGFSGGLVGFLAYDAVYDLWLEEQGIEHPETELPDAQFVLNTKTLVFDHVEDSLSLVCTPLVSPEDTSGEVYDELVAEANRIAETLESASKLNFGGYRPEEETAGAQDEYEDAVRRAKEHVSAGDIYQGVISRKREIRGEIDPRGLYSALREVNPSPYMYLLSYGDRTVVGASPETLVSVRDGKIVSNPIAGTSSRGGSPMEDRRLAGELLADEKERSEHAMLVDLARNDVRRVAESGSIRVEEFMNVIKYSHVQHIESTVTGTMAEDCDAFDAVRATFPAGTLTGAPKIRAMEIIHDLEETPRGVYGGGVGYISWTGDADFAIVIRTATIEHGQAGERDTVTVQAGAGIVADSDPTAEFEETEQKMGGVLSALETMEREPESQQKMEVSR